MSEVNDFYEATIELIELLEHDSHDDRDKKIEKIEELLEKREGFMKSMKPPFSQTDQLLGKQLIELNETVTKLLEREKMAIQIDRKNLNNRRQSTEKYINPYQSLAIDGVFYDKRK